jgi:chromosome segregation ATPase
MSYIETALQIRTLSRQFESLKEAADALEAIGQIDQHKAELEAKVAKAKAELEEAKKQTEEAKERALKMAEVATEEAENVVAHAEEQAARIIDEAKKQATADIQAALEEVNEAQKMQESIGVVSEDLKIQKQELETELADLLGQISEAKAWLAKLASKAE